MGVGERLVQLRERWAFALESLDRGRADEVAAEAIEALGATEFADQVVRPELQRIGDEWEIGQRSLAEIYMGARISSEVFASRFPMPEETGAPIAIALLDDHHALGKALVMMSLRASSVPVRDFGTGRPEVLAAACVDQGIGLIFISTLMLRSALGVSELMEALRARGAETRVVVGGAPFRMDSALWQRVGAHGVGGDASDAVRIARHWLDHGVLPGASS